MAKYPDKIKVGITMGDPAGVGPQIIAKAFKRLTNSAEFVIIADAWVLEKVTGHRSHVSGLKVIDLNNVNQKNFQFGKVRAENGRSSIEYLDKALDLIQVGKIDCLVTCPVSKEAVNLAGISFSGHTEYLAQHTGTEDFVMMLLNRKLKISLVTRHIPISSVSGQLTKEKIYKTTYITHQSLRKIFSIKNPRIVVTALNPHASDNGLIGDEENRIIRPALNKLKHLTGYIHGPISADAAILKAAEKKYDCVVAMYHDQALIALKLSGIFHGVNITLGLPFVRTSPLHGTAFDIAKTNSADPCALIEAIKLAIKCARNLKRV